MPVAGDVAPRLQDPRASYECGLSWEPMNVGAQCDLFSVKRVRAILRKQIAFILISEYMNT